MYAFLLFGITNLISSDEAQLTPVSGQLLGFFSLTLPVFFYFFLSERSKSGATIGKRVVKIRVFNMGSNSNNSFLLRNILKFLPWEIAHTGVHWALFYSETKMSVPIWVWITLVLPQAVALSYLLSVIISKGYGSIYDKIANTRIKIVSS